MNGIVSRALSASAAVLVLAPSAAAFADDVYGGTPSSPPSRVIVTTPTHDVITYEEKTPNSALIGSGSLMFGLAYGGSIIVASVSDREGDQHLYVPVAGPWMDLMNRGDCRGPGCGVNETANKVLLVANGIFQSVGVLQIASGFLFPETRTITRAAKLRVTPNVGKGMVGITASGSF
ncbi:Hypothetical protein A7982_03147 [Minicystis rosea]|nr:Hypothetical protein A7982_03147 [Minicystis rosea]